MERLGGYGRLDPALDPLWDALSRNPYGFEMLETDWTAACRIAATDAVGACPKLVWQFTIDEEKNVEIHHVEEFEDY